MFLIALTACKPSADVEALPPTLFGDPTTATLEVRGTAADGLAVPRDLAFHPEHPDQLWTTNKRIDGVVLYHDPGTPEQASEVRIDAAARHFFEIVSAIAMGDRTDVTQDGVTYNTSSFATCQESRNTYNGTASPNDFMGPSLWPGDLDLFANINQNDPPAADGYWGSHLDMLHQSPMCMGIAHDTGNAYWVFDGWNGHLVWYDFAVPHGFGEDDHSDGKVRRYTEVELTRVPGVPGHMEVDADGFLYIADTGGGRVLKVDTMSGQVTGDLPQRNEPLDEFSEVTGVGSEVFAEGLQEPSGIALDGTVLYVSDHAAGSISAFDTTDGTLIDTLSVAPGVMGIAVSPAGELWYVDAESEELVRVEPGAL